MWALPTILGFWGIAMPLPLIPVAVALAAMGGTGVAAGGKGTADLCTAHRRQHDARERHERALSELKAAHQHIDRALASYGRLQLRVQRDTIGAFVTWLEENEHKVAALQGETIDGIDVEIPELPELRVEVLHATNALKGTATAAITGIAARQAAMAGVRWAATSGTGAAISGLTGAAAQSATYAWLGGGTLAAGGGGVAAGTAVASGIGAAPAFLLAGLALHAEGAKALTAAHQYEADVRVAMEQMATERALLERIDRRAEELRSVLGGLDRRARRSLEQLRGIDFDPDEHVHLFMVTAQLMRALREVPSTPLLDEDGTPSAASRRMTIKYRPTDNGQAA
jgi:hypothetical protein